MWKISGPRPCSGKTCSSPTPATRRRFTPSSPGKGTSSPIRNLALTLRLKNGSIHKLGKEPDAYQKIDFSTYDLRLDLKTDWKEKKTEEKHPADMTLAELSRAIRHAPRQESRYQTPVGQDP